MQLPVPTETAKSAGETGCLPKEVSLDQTKSIPIKPFPWLGLFCNLVTEAGGEVTGRGPLWLLKWGSR